MLSTTTTALSTSMPTASSRPIIDSTLRVIPAKYMKPRVMMKQIGMAVLTISTDGQWRRKNHSTTIDRARPIAPASASATSELTTCWPWSSVTSMAMPRIAGSSLSASISACTARDRSTRLAARSL